MKQILTVRNRLDNPEEFDKEVNNAIKEGWELKKRDVLQPFAQATDTYLHTMLYAELEREVENE